MEAFLSLLPIPIINLLACGLIGQLLGGLVSGYLGGITDTAIEKSTTPNQGMWQSRKNGAILATTGWIVLTILFSLLGLPILAGFILGLSFGIFAFEALIKHFVLRLILYTNGYIPWNYARFLDYATNSILLQKIGGGYIFTHRLLLEHFSRFPIKGREDLDFELITASYLESNNEDYTIIAHRGFWGKYAKLFVLIFLTIFAIASVPLLIFLISIPSNSPIVECTISINQKTGITKIGKFAGGTDCELIRKQAKKGKPLPTTAPEITTSIKSPPNSSKNYGKK